MARYTTTIRTDWDQATAYDYLAEFSNVADWDPSVASARVLSGTPGEVGSEFEVEVESLGRTTKLTYRTTEADAPRKVVVRAETGTLVSLDTLTFDVAPGGGTAVTYDANLSLKGIARLGDPLLAIFFNRLGDKARDGLAARLAEPAPEGAKSAK
jgi:carbon monoxide dehydrogenase subunit G